MDTSAAVKPHPKGCTIYFEVVPGSCILAVPAGYNPWRKAFIAKLKEEPTKGKANQQLTIELAKTLITAVENVQVLSGHKSSRKVLLIEGMNEIEALKKMELKMK